MAFSKLITGPRLFFIKNCFSKNTIKIGVSADFFKNKKGEPKICKVNNWATLPIFKWPKRGPVINFAGGPVINFGNGHFFFIFLLLKMC